MAGKTGAATGNRQDGGFHQRIEQLEDVAAAGAATAVASDQHRVN